MNFNHIYSDLKPCFERQLGFGSHLKSHPFCLEIDKH